MRRLLIGGIVTGLLAAAPAVRSAVQPTSSAGC
jgi:hypothetical protein